MQNNFFIFITLPILFFLAGFQQCRLLLVDLVLGFLLTGLNSLQHLLRLLWGNLGVSLSLTLLRLRLINLNMKIVIFAVNSSPLAESDFATTFERDRFSFFYEI